MATYAIGDIQGCFDAFQCLLEQVKFNPESDKLWLAGDLINRGPKSLETLRYCSQHRQHIIAVQGNHDLHFLAVAQGAKTPKRKDTFDEILNASDREDLIDWLSHNPLLHIDHHHKAVMTHAGLPPLWSLETAAALAAEVEQVLRGSDAPAFFDAMYGNDPAGWSQDLEGPTRWRTITNYFTRMRLCDAQGNLDLEFKGLLEDAPTHLYPWFKTPGRLDTGYKILFGHWAALNGHTNDNTIIGLDTGCVWGNKLSAYCLETETWHSCNCSA